MARALGLRHLRSNSGKSCQEGLGDVFAVSSWCDWEYISENFAGLPRAN
jgi:hypothetical protein